MFKIEFERIRRDWKLVLIFLFLLIISFYFVYSGINAYDSFQKRKEKFLIHERIRTELSLSFAQYGVNGVKILLDYSPLIVFFNSKTIPMITANLNTSEILDVTESKRSENYFFSNRYFNGFFDFLFFFGILIHLYLGWSAFNTFNHINFIKTLKNALSISLSRLFLSLIFFNILFISMFAFASILGVFGKELFKYSLIFFLLSLFALFVFCLCYYLGLSFFLLIKNRKVAIPIMISVILILIFFVKDLMDYKFPKDCNRKNTIEVVKIKKLKRLLGFEENLIKFLEKNPNLSEKELAEVKRNFSDSFLKNEYKENENLEKEFLGFLREKNKNYERIATLFPIIYFDFLSDVVSGKGNYCILKFIEYAIKKRFEFVSWILKKRYHIKEKKKHTIEPFFEGEMAVYYPKINFSERFLKGLTIIIINLLFLFILVLILIWRRLNVKLSGKAPDWKLQPGKIYFKRYNSQGKRDTTFSAFLNIGDKICIDYKDSGIKSYLGCQLDKFIKNICVKINVDEKRFKKILEILIDSEIDWKSKINKDILKRMQLALNLSVVSEGKNTVIFNEYVKNENIEFYEQFIKLIKFLKSEGKSILYLSINMFQFLSEDKYLNTTELMEIDIESIVLR